MLKAQTASVTVMDLLQTAWQPNQIRFYTANLKSNDPGQRSMADRVITALTGMIATDSFLSRQRDQAQAAINAANAASQWEKPCWGALWGATRSPENVAMHAWACDVLEMDALLLLDTEYREPWPEQAAVQFLLFGDGSFIVFHNGMRAIPEYDKDPVLHLENYSVEDIATDIASGSVVEMARFGTMPVAEEGNKKRHESAADGMAKTWHEADDPHFEGKTSEWSNIDKTTIVTTSHKLFVALAQPTSSLAFSVNAAEDSEPGGINENTLEGQDFPADLFADALEALEDMSNLEGGQWVYNDGARDRRSGYIYDATVLNINYDAHDIECISAHERLRIRTDVLRMAKNDPRLAHLRDKLVAAIMIPQEREDA